eukprot:2685058-Alexandrium_andersonii.AAC.1
MHGAAGVPVDLVLNYEHEPQGPKNLRITADCSSGFGGASRALVGCSYGSRGRARPRQSLPGSRSMPEGSSG